MRHRGYRLAAAAALGAASLAALFLVVFECIAAAPPSEAIRVPEGFAVERVARVPSARAMTFGAGGTLFVGSTAGTVYAVSLPANGAGGEARVRVVASGLTIPGGVAFHDGALYVSALDRILRFDGIERRLDDPPKPVVVTDQLPSDRQHGLKYIAFGPDRRLYVNVGAPCNVCEPERDRYAAILRMNADGSGLETFVRGERNSVGFDWDPLTKELWFTSNGRDWLGDDSPPDTLNHAPKAGLDFGFPYCHAGTIPDPDYGKKRACSEFAKPAQLLGAHVAPLGMRFYTGTQFPAAYRNQIFIAEHGSWNRSRKVGYRVTLVRLDAQRRPIGYEPFATGWLQGEETRGRPADVAVAPDGSLLVSDDFAGAIYRVRYRGD